jgi:predicted trehalose synthase
MPDSNHVDIARRYANDGTKAFLDGYDAHAAIAATAERLGDLVLSI